MRNKPIGPVRRWLTDLPLVGPLFACRKEDYYGATREFIIIIAFATATFWLSALVLAFLDSANQLSYPELFQLTIKEGQLFIFSTALLGPILIFATDNSNQARPFPAQTWIILALVLLASICSASYALMKGLNIPGSNIPLNRSLFANTAIVCAIISALFRYMAIVYNKYRMRPEEVKASQEDFLEKFKRRHSDEGEGQQEDAQ